ncbi:MAG TPA: AAA family ATPase, partial [Gemmatimonadales bacterium]|nr:AAA family ATPase [Gemmatimonadales bacterium]
MTDVAPKPTVEAAPGPEPVAPMPWLEEMPPRLIVAELDRYIVGQEAAKKAVAIAVRNRWRRAQAPDDIRDEITPYNIIMIGPTGVGKTEVARRLARLSGAPFIKVEASKFTEVGYVGRDAESMVRDLVDSAINLVRTEREDEVYPQAEQRADERLLDLLLPAGPQPMEWADKAEGSDRAEGSSVFVVSSSGQAKPERPPSPEEERRHRSREKLREMLADGRLDDREVEVEVAQQGYPMME